MANVDYSGMEKKWQEYWEKEKIYAFNSKSKKKIYSIDTPPPTVSGDMHMGHAFSYSQQDFIARYKRMNGFEVFYPFGTDDNGLPTERLIERIKGAKSKQMTRAEFIELCLKTLKEITPSFVQDWKDLAISCDYGLYYSTINDSTRKLSQKYFLELFKKGLAYKDDFPTIYCPECQTPVAQAELEDKNKETFFTTLKFESEGKILPIATTRPEMLGACVCVFVNPEDKRYKHLVGRKAKVPLFDLEVPIIADKSAEIDKGTGVLMICSYGDKYDVDAIKRYKLEARVIFDKHGRVSEGRHTGLTIKQARQKVLEELKDEGFIIEQKKIEHVVNVHDKCGTEIEFLPVEQWFIKILDNKKKLVAQGEKVDWMPDFMAKRYKNWVEGLDWDWSASRDRHFGIPVPFWHCRHCDELIPAEEKELPVDPMTTRKICKKCKKDAEGETKVLDTWVTSSLTPQIADSLVNGKIGLPFDLRPQAHDIIRTWAFYTIVRGLYHDNEIPWKNISISGFVTLKGEKMGKSKGNAISPRASMKEFGADALRYWASSSKLGEDMEYMEKDLVAGKKFVTKLLNAAKFVFMSLEHQKKMPALSEADRIFLRVFNEIIHNSQKEFEEYNYAGAKGLVERFFWQEFADNYLEIVKGRVYNGNAEEKASAFYTLYNVLYGLVRMMAPITPYICEEVYQEHFRKYEKEKSVHLTSWPEKIKIKEEKEDLAVWARMVKVIGDVRRAKSENKKAMNSEIVLTLAEEDLKMLKSVVKDLKNVLNAREIVEGKFGVEFL